MGAWGIGSFENDDALDFLADVTESGNLSLIREAFDRVLASTEYLEAHNACQAIAAAEIVAAALGRPTPAAQAEEDLSHWLERAHPTVDVDLAARARDALSRILGDNSELRDFWEEEEEFSECQATVTALRQRLEG